jgi:hypothetical protein
VGRYSEGRPFRGGTRQALAVVWKDGRARGSAQVPKWTWKAFADDDASDGAAVSTEHAPASPAPVGPPDLLRISRDLAPARFGRDRLTLSLFRPAAASGVTFIGSRSRRPHVSSYRLAADCLYAIQINVWLLAVGGLVILHDMVVA